MDVENSTDIQSSDVGSWRILSLNTLTEVDVITPLLFKKIHFLEKSVKVIPCSSFEDAETILSQQSDISVILLGLSQQNEQDGLNFIRFVRETIHNYEVRIILRTGYPDIVPDKSLIQDYEIDGYLSKEIVSNVQFEITIITALRSYHRMLTTKIVLQSLAGSIAHEIRNPLSQVKYSLDTISQGLPILNQNHAERVEIATRSLVDLYHQVDSGQNAIKRGLQIISMMLNEIKGKAVHSDQLLYLSARKITQKAVSEYVFESEQEQSKVKIDLNQDFTFKIDETLYVFILFNLIKNALYYLKTHPNSEIVIRTERDDNQNYVYVKDTGPGISIEHRKQLFNSFFTSGKKEGTGLGLAYCHRVMQAFGGYISCDSVEGEFTEFKLAFPKLTKAELKAHKDSVIASALPVLFNKKILLVDDELTNRMIACKQLEPFDMTIDQAEDGEQAINQVKANHYDFIFMDINMPKMNGYEASHAIRQYEIEQSKQPTLIFAYSSELKQIAQLKASWAGMAVWITKPSTQVELIRTIQSILEEQNAILNQSKDFSDKVILIADDNEINLQIVQAYLKKYKIKKILKASHGAAVLEILKTETCDLVLMDIQMPGMNGLEATRQLRSQQAFSAIPIIAVSGEDIDDTRAEAHSSGMSDYIVKPITSDALQKILVKWL